MPLQKDTVAVPVMKGIDTHTAARLVAPDSLLEAINARLTGGGSRKRDGHSAVKVRQGTYPPNVERYDLTTPTIRPFGEKTLDSQWVWGWGLENNAFSSDDTQNFPVSEYPEAGLLVGGATRDDEILSWNGFNLYSYTPGTGDNDANQMVALNAVMPALRAKPVAKVSAAQRYPDSADNGARRCVCWLDAETSTIHYTVLDSTTGAVVLRDSVLSATSITGARVVSLGSWFHIVVLDSDLDDLRMFTFHQQSPRSVTTRSLGEAAYFDLWKHNENTLLVVRSDLAHAVIMSWFRDTGSSHPDYTSNITMALDHTAFEVGVCLHPAATSIGLIYSRDDGFSILVGVYNIDGTQLGGDFSLTATVGGEQVRHHRLTVAPRLEQSAAFADTYDAYASISDGTQFRCVSQPFSSSGMLSTIVQRYHMAVASHAFNVGHRTFVWASLNSTLQSLWVLLDSQLLPIGRLDFEVAATPTPADTDLHLSTPNFITPAAQKDRLLYHMALGYRVRVPTDDDQVGLYTEESIKHVELDFLPWLRGAQAGRCTYFAGAQLWAYDGAELVESGFHVAPEFSLEATNGGSLTALGTYSYRIDLCYPNAQNEEVRSHSLLVQKILTGSQGTITLTIKPCPTRREGAYFLIFRNAMVSGAPTTSWNLLNSRDPSNARFIPNDNTAATVTFVDDGTIFSDTAIQAREAYPGNNSAYLYPFSAPACELVCAGADRLWVAGGELPAGQVAPSRLFNPGEVPAFNANINRQVDRGDERLTALGFVGGIVAVFRPQSVYVLDGDGPDNFASGYWPPARLALADVGAVSQESIAVISGGLLFQARPGIRMIGPGGAISPIGHQIDPTAEANSFTVRSAIVVPLNHEVRWYGEERVVVYNYLDDCWSTWTLGSAGSVFSKTSELGIVFGAGGDILIETAGLYTDAGDQYEHRIRFPWLHAGQLGDFQRIRRFAAFGTWDGTPHRVRAEIYFDEQEHWAEYWEWDVPDVSQNNDAWGDNTWGAGSWGDTQDATLHDSVWRWRRRPRRQKCSVFSIAISDLGTDGPGFVLTVLGLELAKKAGIDRIPAAGGTNSYR